MTELALHELGPDGLTRHAWDRFLRALAPDAALAASRYEELRHRLIELYRWRGLPWPEDLADEAFDRVAHRLALGLIVEPDVGAYLCSEARQIAGEASRKKRREQPIDPIAAPEVAVAQEVDDPLSRLCACLDQLPGAEREILLAYEAGSRRERIHRRKALAAELGIEINALRVRVHRLRARVVAMMAAEAASAPPKLSARRSPGTTRGDRLGVVRVHRGAMGPRSAMGPRPAAAHFLGGAAGALGGAAGALPSVSAPA